jgi:1-aminocyclopropane-1-carboxylate deaminase
VIDFPNIQSPVQYLYSRNGAEVHILREDLLHPLISGNKYRKLKYNLKAFEDGNYSAILTFGGAYSNHIHAVSAAGRAFGFKTIGVIRGDELTEKIVQNPTLTFAESCGMELRFISREKYRQKSESGFLDAVKNEFGNVYILPEGGTNTAAVRGCEEIQGNHTFEFDYICCAVGTGGTLAGIINSAKKHQKILGFPALKNSEYLYEEIKKYVYNDNFELIHRYHFGGFAKQNPELIDFINKFKRKFGLTLDPVYTAKMMFGIEDMILNDYFVEGSKILAVHTGGLQGIVAMNQKLKSKNQPEIE